jgi:hypothetical protein
MAEFLQTILTVPAVGTTTLYRAEAAPTGRRTPPWIIEAQDRSGHSEAAGRWFTADQDALDWYVRDAGPRACVFSIDVPTADLETLRVSNSTEVIAGRRISSFSRDPTREFFLPKSLVSSRLRLHKPLTALPRSIESPR